VNSTDTSETNLPCSLTMPRIITKSNGDGVLMSMSKINSYSAFDADLLMGRVPVIAATAAAAAATLVALTAPYRRHNKLTPR